MRVTLVRAILTVLESSETISECTVIARIVCDYVRATHVRPTLIRLGLSDHIRVSLPHANIRSDLNSNIRPYEFEITLPEWWELLPGVVEE